ncbi:hypothetical protein C0993_005673 [Termitomyces sp. T159_Od127]|nr:hypothetical protein C0993_005673 [Termitomyces sp. T159_Od127]
MPAANPPESYVCDTLPAPKLAAEHDVPAPRRPDQPQDVTPLHATPRKLCFRHQRMADEGINLKLQQSLDAMPLDERQAVNAIWSSFSSSSHPRRALILQGLLTMCCFSQLSLLTEHLAHLIRIDPFACFPREVSLKILGYLDATSLCRAAQVTKRWKALADDDILWRGICEQHIGQKCAKCGWGLPVLEKKRGYRPRSISPPIERPPTKRAIPEEDCESRPPLKRHCSGINEESESSCDASCCALLTSIPFTESVTRPWKDVYSERMTIERNWRRGRCTVRTLKGHTDGVMCLQFNENLSYPAFPVLITGSYDRTVRVWNMETGVELHTLKGHTRAIRALQFDDIKLITGSMDHTLKVWDWRRGKCIRTLTGHTDGVLCLNFDSNVLASGSVDTTIKVWNLRTGGAFTLRGHSDWVNAVQLWDSNPSARTEQSNVSLFDAPGCGSLSPQSSACSSSEIDAGKMLFSASDDGSIKLWDLTLRTCLRTLTGHMGQVQSMKLLPASDCDSEELPAEAENSEQATTPSETPLESVSSEDTATPPPPETTMRFPNRKKPVLISGSLDNTIKLWDIETGKCTRTFFGHIEGVWAVACDKMRLVSGSHDRTIKVSRKSSHYTLYTDVLQVWSLDEGKCTATLVGHKAAVSCLALGEDKIVSGSDDTDIKIWSFSG